MSLPLVDFTSEGRERRRRKEEEWWRRRRRRSYERART